MRKILENFFLLSSLMKKRKLHQKTYENEPERNPKKRALLSFDY